jgi:hypothetical protein
VSPRSGGTINKVRAAREDWGLFAVGILRGFTRRRVNTGSRKDSKERFDSLCGRYEMKTSFIRFPFEDKKKV